MPYRYTNSCEVQSKDACLFARACVRVCTYAFARFFSTGDAERLRAVPFLAAGDALRDLQVTDLSEVQASDPMHEDVCCNKERAWHFDIQG